MRLNCFQHVPFEDAAQIGAWAARRGHSLATTHLYRGDALPAHDSYDMLLVMGGPMNIYEHGKYPWLVAEKKFIREAIDAGKAVLGACLGGQLVADVLGGPVTRNRAREIGWHPVRLRPEAAQCGLLSGWPAEFTPLSWHGDAFAIPPGALRLASSEACATQAFAYGDRVVGFQFHVEYQADSIRAMLAECADELADGGPFVQAPEEILAGLPKLEQAHALLESMLEWFEKLAG